MIDFSLIKSKKLCTLIKASAKFKLLSEFHQQRHIADMQDLSPENEQRLCDFFEKENAKENTPLTNEEQLETLRSMYDELLELTEKFAKLMNRDLESKQRDQDDENLDNLLASLNN